MYIFDAHCDYLWRKARGIGSDIKGTDSLIEKSVFAVFEGNPCDKELVERQYNIYCGGNAPVDRAYTAFEGLSWVKSLYDAEELIKRSPLYVGPVWNKRNVMGGSCYEDSALTVFGECFLHEIDKSGIFIDLAHTGDGMFNSCLDHFENVIYSHGNVFEVHSHPRNLKREQIQRLIQRGSFMGISLYSGFVGGRSIDKLFEHIEAVLDMGGERIIGFGSDIDGCESLVGNNDDSSVFNDICEEFFKRNYPAEIIEGILHKNLERVIENRKKSG